MPEAPMSMRPVSSELINWSKDCSRHSPSAEPPADLDGKIDVETLSSSVVGSLNSSGG